eukprot:GHUV01038289.1.p1 GENE.GHUV01038289.1~~GHUV01038289.1.p1  ORF type:complete len:223 (+),score=69.70 GHUV01038289.1:167-835(+)
MSRSRCFRRILRAACAGYEQRCQASIGHSLEPLPQKQYAAQPGIDYAAWVRQQQAWRGFAAAPARAVQDSMEEVAERKLAEARVRHEALQKQIQDTNPASEAYQRLMKESAYLTPLAEGHRQLQQMQQEVSGLQEMLSAETDKELQDMAQEELQQLQQQIAELRQSLLLSLLPPESSDEASVVLEIRSSVGGDWTAGFADDLLEMYRAFAAEHRWRFECCNC